MQRRHLILSLIFLFVPILSWAEEWSPQSDYTQCIVSKYSEQMDGPANCDFSNLRSYTSPLLRECRNQVMDEMVLRKIEPLLFMDLLNEAKAAALSALNKELNSQLQKCGYRGYIELTATGGKIEISNF